MPTLKMEARSLKLIAFRKGIVYYNATCPSCRVVMLLATGKKWCSRCDCGRLWRLQVKAIADESKNYKSRPLVYS